MMARRGKKKSPASLRDELDARTIALIDRVAGQVRDSIERGELPAIRLPVRSLANVTYDSDKGYF
ncbi:MAG: hypothetical protein KAR37_12870, partial [Alphaproteobacteria bacterium]|nr:hypothetical protein [Alphaproteobacteria bacterium]